MVFVHARKETVKTAQRLKEMAGDEGVLGSFDPREHPKFDFYRRDISTSRNKEMKELFDDGFGIHHAGMLRSDRNMMERMFEDQAIKVGSSLGSCDETLIPYRCCVVHRPWLGVSICPHMQSSSRAHRYMIAVEVLLSIFPSSTSSR